jgi:hypothetical protein
VQPDFNLPAHVVENNNENGIERGKLYANASSTNTDEESDDKNKTTNNSNPTPISSPSISSPCSHSFLFSDNSSDSQHSDPTSNNFSFPLFSPSSVNTNFVPSPILSPATLATFCKTQVVINLNSDKDVKVVVFENKKIK